ncbi:acetate/propionate family kinase [Mycoplasmopsis gallinarum]|uniref:Acetate kinase n=1 Tax=Mycoplasmopsis gallinarum TaxID=29557 RepID=A0A168R6Z9_9BACT|nr:acetate/propionate family kinase [Mycoplasmopsis gallinarum]OAB48662.1 Acetate kinase [Mycoplasmopsis gallinarum]
MKKILVINAGSSSLKWAFYNEDNLTLTASGLCERINLDGRIITKYNGEKFIDEINLPNHSVAVENLIKLWAKYDILHDLDQIYAIGFRTPLAGHNFLSPVFYDEKVKEGIEEAAKFIPLHAPATLAAVEAFEKYLPKVKKIIAQDTAFHTTIPAINSTFGINQEWAEKFHIKKFGYHGLSHDYINDKIKEILKKDKNNIVVAHLGSGSSICAIKNSKSFDVTVGFSSFDGLMMGTRTGAIDPGITDYLVRIEKQDIQEVFDMMVKKSGLLGVSGLSNDIRDLHAVYDTNPKAKLAIDLFVSKVIDYLVAYLNKVGPKIDALVFTAGIGENDDIIRQSVIKGLTAYNVALDEAKNLQSYDDYELISTPNSEFPIYKIRTNEEIVIAKYVKEMMQK